MSIESIYRWHDGGLAALEYCDMTDTVIEVADSWFVGDGRVLALDVHRSRFLRSMPAAVREATRAEEFWSSVVALLPREGEWFPRVELQRRGDARLLVFRTP
ncbi:MAG: hypothetical protein WDM88_13685 [Galbitalea sp.]